MCKKQGISVSKQTIVQAVGNVSSVFQLATSVGGNQSANTIKNIDGVKSNEIKLAGFQEYIKARKDEKVLIASITYEVNISDKLQVPFLLVFT